MADLGGAGGAEGLVPPETPPIHLTMSPEHLRCRLDELSRRIDNLELGFAETLKEVLSMLIGKRATAARPLG